MLQAYLLNKQYGSKKVLKNVSLSVHAGEIIGLLGPNGAGKTTFFKLLMGLDSVDDGEIIFCQENITSLSITQRASAGMTYLPQDSSIFRGLTVRENIQAVIEAKDPLESENSDKVDELIDSFQLTSFENTMGHSLSGGQRRRTEIARTLALDPKLILLDEPFSGVDPLSIQESKQLIKKVADRGIGILITDHNVREILSICDRAYVVVDGCLLASGTPQAIMNDKKVKMLYLGQSFDMSSI